MLGSIRVVRVTLCLIGLVGWLGDSRTFCNRGRGRSCCDVRRIGRS